MLVFFYISITLLLIVLQTNDVNQGDALEHDFSTLHLALIFPVKHLLDASLSQVHHMHALNLFNDYTV